MLEADQCWREASYASLVGENSERTGDEFTDDDDGHEERP